MMRDQYQLLLLEILQEYINAFDLEIKFKQCTKDVTSSNIHVVGDVRRRRSILDILLRRSKYGQRLFHFVILLTKHEDKNSNISVCPNLSSALEDLHDIFNGKTLLCDRNELFNFLRRNNAKKLEWLKIKEE